MKLVIDRNQADRKGVLRNHRGVRFAPRTQLQHTDQEGGLLDRNKLWDYSQFTRGGLPVAIRHMATGDELTLENVEILLENEQVVARSLDQLPPLLEVLGTFHGSEVVEYPRK